MPRYYERKGGGAPYVKGHMDGAFCTWQVTEACADRLRNQGYRHGDDISQRYVNRLKARGDLYTGGAGVSEFMERSRSRPTGKPTKRKRIPKKDRKKPRVIVVLALFWICVAVLVSLFSLPVIMFDPSKGSDWGKRWRKEVDWAWSTDNWTVDMTDSGYQEWVSLSVGFWLITICYVQCSSCL